ncbi:MAG: DEAD/DEAH box helicase [Gammaproteobacteria bacterium]|nr:DEAD/DEAH box helicase [Gammaproteobacteria bacterium]
MNSALFHPAVEEWFATRFGAPTPAQAEAWPAIRQGRHTLIAAPTGSGKTLAAFLSAIDALVREGLDRGLRNETHVLYVSPLKALSNDIQKNLQEPLCGIADKLNEQQLPAHGIRVQVRTGDTPQSERQKMRREPPHILVTTPESLFILLTSESGRRMLSTVRTVIVDEIHALADNKRGTHLSLSLERLEALVTRPTVRIGLSATQRPIELMAKFLVGDRDGPCNIIDSGHVRRRDLALELPASPLEAVMASEVWSEVYDRLAQLAREHRTTLVFVNTRRLAERAAHHLGERLGDEHVTAHHGSLAREHRLDAEQRLKCGDLKLLVATASLELGIDIGEVDLVCQLGSPRSIAAFLQRVGRSGHQVDGTPKGRLFPLSRDELVECVALLDAVRRDELDALSIPPGHLDVLAQQLIAELASRDWNEDELYARLVRAWPYRQLARSEFDAVLNMLADGFTTRRGRRSRYVQRDAVHRIARGRPGARLTAVTNAGAIPDQFDYEVILEPDGHFIGTVNEDFAFESLPGDIFQLGNTSYRIRKVEQGKLRVEDAHGLPPNMPFWLGEAPGRTDELSFAVSRLRRTIDEKLDSGMATALRWVLDEVAVDEAAAIQMVEYLATARAALGRLPSREDIIFERFFDETGDQHLVIHSTYGSRLNRAWGLGLRKRFCRKFNFELQAAALEDSIVISLGATHSFPLEDVARYLHSGSVREIVTQAMLAVPMFGTHWRWNAGIALAIRRNRNGKRVPAQFQRMDAEDLMALVFPDQLACQDNLVGERQVPDHPLVAQTVADCLHDVMDIEGLEQLLRRFENGEIRIHARDLGGPSPLAQEILSARPYAFLDDAPAEERRTRAVAARRFLEPADAADLGRLDPAAIAQVRTEAWPVVSGPEDLHDALTLCGFIREREALQPRDALLDWRGTLENLVHVQRATVLDTGHERLWVCAERLPQALSAFPGARLEPPIRGAGPAAAIEWTTESARVELLRARLECLGPVSEPELAESFACSSAGIQAALCALEAEGYCMRGQFTGRSDTEWCERALLARIHRYTLQSLRREIQPVSTQDYMRFLFRWHGLGAERAEGDAALHPVLERLEGFSIAAAAWESDVLPARLADFTPDSLDRLCSAGRFMWLRLRAERGRPAEDAETGNHATILRNSPVALLARFSAPHWLALSDRPAIDTAPLSTPARIVAEALKQHGASFFTDLVSQSGLLRTQVEEALAELAAAGLVNSDSFAGLRSLIAPAGRRGANARQPRPRRGAASDGLDDAGRWSIVPNPNVEQGEGRSSGWITTPLESLEIIVHTLLKRYGVVFRRVLERESPLPPWRELLYVLRRMEARGEVRGGRFVDGFSGEQFALPDAVGLLRNARKSADDEWIAISAADPLNLTGIILPGERIPAAGSHRVVFRNGLPVARQSGRDIEFLQTLDNEQAWQVRNLFARRRNPAAYFSSPPHIA